MRFLLLLAALGWMGQLDAWAQLSYGGGRSASQAAGVGVAFVSFEYTGSSSQEANFSFTNPAYGVVLSRPGLLAGFHRGTQDTSAGEDLTFTEFGLLAFGSFRPFSPPRGSSAGRLEPLIPLGVQTTYRRVSRDLDTGTFNAFEFTVAAIGAGIGVQRETRSSLFVLRAMPMFGIAARSFGSDTGTSRIVDVDAELQLGPWSDRFGVMAGWGFRWQDWNLNASRLVTNANPDTFDYAGFVHSIRLGLIF
jgi:hypothetical protein